MTNAKATFRLTSEKFKFSAPLSQLLFNATPHEAVISMISSK